MTSSTASAATGAARPRSRSTGALDFLVEHRFAHRIESRNAYVACDRGSDCEGETTLFFLCDQCGAAGEASSAALHDVLADGHGRGRLHPVRAGGRDPRPLRQLPVMSSARELALLIPGEPALEPGVRGAVTSCRVNGPPKIPDIVY